MTIADYYAMGGDVMHVLSACSVLVLAIALERLFALRPGAVTPRAHVTLLRKLASAGDVAELSRCGGDSPAPLHGLTRIAVRTLVRDGRRAAEEALSSALTGEAFRLGRNLPLLAALANIATLIGLLGTVLGMIEAFQAIASQGVSDARTVASGIFRALVTTAGGLGIGILALAFHAAFRRRAENLVERLEGLLEEVLDALDGSDSEVAASAAVGAPGVATTPVGSRSELSAAEAG